MPSRLVRRCAAALAALLITLAACWSHPGHQVGRSGQSTPADGGASPTGPSSGPSHAPPPDKRAPAPFRHLLPGMPPVIDDNVYAATRAGMLSTRVAKDPAYLYVPDSTGTTTTVIDQRTHQVVRTISSGYLSQHVNPSYDLKTLYADASAADRLVAINPRTARVERRIRVPRPYNVYFTPDGRQAVVMVEQRNEILFRDPQSFKPREKLRPRGCDGPNHADFSGNGRFMVVDCEFSGTLLKISTLRHRVMARVQLGRDSMPQDIRISPDGTTFYVADMTRNRVRLINWKSFKQVSSIKTPAQPHGLYPSRDGRFLYVSDRGAGEVSVVSFATRRIVDTWTIPGGGSPDMGGVSADGRVLWLSGRYDSVVYGFNTRTGRLIARIPVPGSPHGLCVWPQPGRYSLGHTGNMR
jgi:DNA-binding beta-propeller fold protein YncE